jgi:molybdenum cofactor synthesis domain-containing protein
LYRAGVLVLSDKGSIGQREDTSGLAIIDSLKENGFLVQQYKIIPDEYDLIVETLIDWSDNLGLNIILTTGGTGFSKRDNTPEATLNVVKRRTPGISEAIRYNSLKITPRGMLSRGESGIRDNTLIINLPGSKKAVVESMDYIIKSIIHGLDILLENDSDCAR